MPCFSFAMGIGVPFFNIPVTVIFQKSCADEYRGRFWGFYSSISSVVIPVAYLLGGFIAQRIPLILIIASSGILFLILDLFVVNMREAREP
jgi:MFS family permease